MPLDLDQLSPAERAVWDAFPLGEAVELPAGGPVSDRTVRAEVIATLLRGGSASPAALDLTGARITGALDLGNVTVTAPLSLRDCELDTAPDLTGATVRRVRIRFCRLPGFSGRLMRAEGDLDFRGSVVRGQINLIRATITGELRLAGATLHNPGAWALYAGGMVVQSAFFGSPRLRGPGADEPVSVVGGVRLVGARLLGGAFLDGIRLSNPGGVALHGDNLTVFGRMQCEDGFTADGRIQLNHARVEGVLSFRDATLRDGEVALSLDGSVVGELNLRTATAPTGLVDLRHVHCGLLRDAAPSWPAALALDGLTYDAIDADRSALAVGQRLDWLRRGPDGYRPQPYEQLAALYRRLGADGDARRVLLVKQRRHRRERGWFSRILGHLLDATVGYGYRPWRAAVWLVLMLALGTTVFSAWPPIPTAAARPFDAVMYTLDLLVPISAFGLRDAFVPVGSTRWLAYALTAAGWLLATALVAGITRALRRD